MHTNLSWMCLWQCVSDLWTKWCDCTCKCTFTCLIFMVSLLSCSSWATGTAPLNHSSITAHKAWWYLPRLSHKPVKTCFLLFHTLGSFQPTTALAYLQGSWFSVTCSHVPIHQASITPKEIPIQSGHNTHKKGKNRQLFTLPSCSFITYIHWKPV